jgi:hypothetical protein
VVPSCRVEVDASNSRRNHDRLLRPRSGARPTRRLRTRQASAPRLDVPPRALSRRLRAARDGREPPTFGATELAGRERECRARARVGAERERSLGFMSGSRTGSSTIDSMHESRAEFA